MQSVEYMQRRFACEHYCLGLARQAEEHNIDEKMIILSKMTEFNVNMPSFQQAIARTCRYQRGNVVGVACSMSAG
jgi:hypothetical protein